MNDENDNKRTEKIIAELEKELGLESHDLLNNELGLVEKISSLTSSVEDKLKKLYSAKFPKKCNTCQKVYESRAAYLQETKLFSDGRNNSIAEKATVQEYRDCVCGSTLVVITEDRRDTTEFGEARRKLFDVCVDKIIEVTGQDKALVIDKMRELFRQIIHKAQYEPNEYFKDKKKP